MLSQNAGGSCSAGRRATMPSRLVFNPRRHCAGETIQPLPWLCLERAAFLFFSFAALALAACCDFFFWFDFGDLSPMVVFLW